MAPQRKPPITEKAAGAWLLEKAKTATAYRANIMNRYDRISNSILIGKMIFYYYDPKHKDTLPIYDRFPLVLPIEQYSNGFLGLNLHYLPRGIRIQILGKLMMYKNNNKMDETTRLKISYEILKPTRVMPVLKNCVKRYLYSHVRSPFVEIDAAEWPVAIELPVAIFRVKGKR